MMSIQLFVINSYVRMNDAVKMACLGNVYWSDIVRGGQEILSPLCLLQVYMRTGSAFTFSSEQY